MKNKFYVTAAIPYVNARPHIGYAMELVQTDVIARYHELIGDEVLFLTGSDENALKNVHAAEKIGKNVQEFVDENANVFLELSKKLNTRVDIFQKGSDQKTHHRSSHKLWELCAQNGDIYEKEYKGLYCVGCEMFYEKDELDENGECFEHPGKKLEEVSEKNYFFKLSRYQDQIITLIESNELKIVPETKRNEILSFLKHPLHDISISRSNTRAKNWGVPVPGDPTQRMYVWFDALNIYQSGIGFGWDDTKYEKWWPADTHVIGKGIIRFHAVYWPAFLLSAGLKLPKQLFVHGYITVDGQKMSKSLGNVVDPFELIEKYGVDAIRYYFLREIPSYGDGDFSERRFKELYNSDLANGLGNLVARVARLAEKLKFQITSFKPSLYPEVERALKEYRFDTAVAHIWQEITLIDKLVNDKKPWIYDLATYDGKEYLAEFLLPATTRIYAIAFNLAPFLPTTARKIRDQFTGEIKSSNPLFPRIE